MQRQPPATKTVTLTQKYSADSTQKYGKKPERCVYLLSSLDEYFSHVCVDFHQGRQELKRNFHQRRTAEPRRRRIRTIRTQKRRHRRKSISLLKIASHAYNARFYRNLASTLWARTTRALFTTRSPPGWCACSTNRTYKSPRGQNSTNSSTTPRERRHCMARSRARA